MDAVTYPDPEVRAELAGWIERRIDVSASPDVARTLGVPAVPAALALTGDGRILARREGFVEPAAFAGWLAATRATVAR